MENPTVFTLAGVSYAVHATPILSDISLDIHSGEHWALMGPSGAGKSTLLRLFNGLISPTSGEIRFHGQPLEVVNIHHLRQKVGMLFQEAVMINGTVRDNLTLPRKWRRPEPDYSNERLAMHLERVGLSPDILKAQARSLSGGEKQRVALARVLLNDPEVLLLDEPTASLDPPLARKILRLIAHLQSDLNLTVIRVSHHPELVRTHSDQIVFLKDGRLVEQGPIALLDDPQESAFQKFLEEARP